MKWFEQNIQTISASEYEMFYALMDKSKRLRVDRCRFIEDKKRTIGGEMLVRVAIAQWCGCSIEEIRFTANDNGKPAVENFPVEFNISHSNDLIVCAVDDNPVGIDIEYVRPINLAITQRICTDEELEYVFGHTPVDADFTHTTEMETLIRFYEIWTCKEACGKLTGNGLGDLRNVPAHTSSATFAETCGDDRYVISIAQHNVTCQHRDANT